LHYATSEMSQELVTILNWYVIQIIYRIKKIVVEYNAQPCATFTSVKSEDD